ncbi:MAG: hypothetical protein LBL49_06285 [Clostridiales Family XIII bacterium]|nr:hypothetical protein [Clostridiales Family XIII bacterium]
MRKKRRISIAVCIVVFLTPMLSAGTIGALYLRPYVEYGDVLSALKVCDSRIEDVKLYLQQSVGTTLTTTENHSNIYDNEELEIKIFLGSKDVSKEASAEIGNAAKDVLDAYIREHLNESTGLEKRLYMVLYPVSLPERGLSYSDVGSRVYYRIWDFENESFEWMLDGDLRIYQPEGHPDITPYWFGRALRLYQSYF